ncbi:MAG: 4-hydroxy-tetrahydrodipicolinate reductase [Bacteroidota bacterium]|nr:4-hydroxy-tetrahydrodipicolinate reductase [Bacteroidota bacterium]MDP4272725.1 4-hydroxy-tetrahydrodipicolinate reductase [Bacteroidota bacterium]
MEIALIGYGKMGKEIEAVCRERNHHVALIIDVNNPADLNAENLKNVDVAIEFTTPQTAYNNVLKCFSANVPVVCGTTGWLDNFDHIQQICNEQKQGFFYSSNYSLGVNLFFKLNSELARLMNGFDNYEVSMTETHHVTKKDAPSGTAISLANDIIKNLDRKKEWKLDENGKDIISIHAFREGTVPGIHTVKYDSPVDYIEIIHSAKSRKGLAFGAVMAAEFLKGKQGIFGMEDLLHF